MTRHLFILNPAAGTKNRTEKLKEAIGALKLTDEYDIYTDPRIDAAGKRNVD